MRGMFRERSPERCERADKESSATASYQRMSRVVDIGSERAVRESCFSGFDRLVMVSWY